MVRLKGLGVLYCSQGQKPRLLKTCIQAMKSSAIPFSSLLKCENSKALQFLKIGLTHSGPEYINTTHDCYRFAEID